MNTAIAIDSMDIAYIAIGAHEALSELPQEQYEALIEEHGGEYNFIREAIDAGVVLMAKEWNEDFHGVWYYDVAEEWGKAYVNMSEEDRANKELLSNYVRLLAQG